MDTVILISQLLIALGIFNVWLIRFNKWTPFRPGTARNMKSEFSAYGLPSATVYVIGGLKLICAAALVAGLWLPELIRPAAIGVAALMAGAIAMHLKVKDPLFKSIPASVMLLLSLLVVLSVS